MCILYLIYAHILDSGAAATMGTVYVGNAQNSSHFSFKLKFITSRIKKCQGCQRNFRRSKASPLIPPDDLLVSHLEPRPYRSKSGVTVTPPKPSNAYYHLDIGCIQQRNPGFKPSNLVISNSDKSKLSGAHREKLQTLGLTVC